MKVYYIRTKERKKERKSGVIEGVNEKETYTGYTQMYSDARKINEKS